MNRADDVRIWMVTGALGSMALAIVLIPLRSAVSASNLAFVFMAFTIIVAELGGRGPALVTALVSAMSLNFFLTEPYLTLAITKTDDVIAFFALGGCGLIAAAFGRRRERLSEVAGRADRDLAILSRLVDRARSGRSVESQLEDLRPILARAAWSCVRRVDVCWRRCRKPPRRAPRRGSGSPPTPSSRSRTRPCDSGPRGCDCPTAAAG